MRVRAGAATDVGLVREGNEDSFVADQPLYAVADGMGGHRGGEVASHLALETLEALFRRSRGSLGEQVREANRAVFERSHLDRAVAGMGTTLTAAAVEEGRLRLVHVGDSRAYLLREGSLQLLTEDHTLVHEMVKRGELTEQEAEVHPHRSVLTRAVGTEADVQVDEFVVGVRDGDRVMLCTDGLNAMVPQEEIGSILVGEPDPQRAAELLVRAANRAGGIDNTTVVVLDFEEDRRSAASSTPTSTRTPAVPRAPGPEAPGPGAPLAERKERRARWPRLLAWIGGLVVALALVVTGVRVYLDAQWYVGISQGRVAVFRGIPTRIAGFELHTVVEETEILAVKAQELPFYGDLPDGITADGREEAEAIVDQIRADLAEAEARREPKEGAPA